MELDSKMEAKNDMVDDQGEQDNKKARRGWSITEWKHLMPNGEEYHPDAYFKSLVDEGTLKYVHLGAWEKAPSTGREHRHSLFWFPRNQKKTAIYKILGYTTFAKTSYHEEAYKRYSVKDGPGVEFGSMDKAGARNDIKEAYDNAKKANGDMEKLMEGNPVEFMKYSGAMTKVCKQFEKPPAFRKVEVVILNGKPGTGKSHYPACKHGEENVYRLTKNIYEGKFWRGFKQQTVLLIEEFTIPWMKHEEFNSVCDGQPYIVPVLHSYEYARWTKVFITCNRARGDYNFYKNVWDKFPNLRKAFDSRVTQALYVQGPIRCPHVAHFRGQLRRSYAVTRLTIIYNGVNLSLFLISMYRGGCAHVC